jgi:hypothetical protein
MIVKKQILNIKHDNYHYLLLIYIKNTRVEYYDYVKTIIYHINL